MKEDLKKILANLSKPIISKLHPYKDYYKGEECYLFGDGISIKWFELDAFNDKISIPCGYIGFHNDFSKLNVHEFFLCETWMFYPFLKTITTPPYRLIQNKIQSLYKRELIKKYPDKKFFLNLSNYLTTRGENIVYVFNDFYDQRLPNTFITNQINALHGTLRFSISMAIYMGFRKINLVGYDYTHVPSRSHHWYEKGEGVFVDQNNYNKDYLKIANEFIDITTITLDGSSSFLNSITYKDYTGRDPIFKENNALIDEKYLKVLSSNPRYKIY
jgi:hypothetical protein